MKLFFPMFAPFVEPESWWFRVEPNLTSRNLRGLAAEGCICLDLTSQPLMTPSFSFARSFSSQGVLVTPFFFRPDA
jgi:hypothetical protein